jgi:alkyl hydroperoxide reductase subunit D
MNWVDDVRGSLPAHVSDLSQLIDSAINHSALDPVDAHACALVAAISNSNGELAYEIQHNSVLVGKPERKAAKIAAANESVNSVWFNYVEMAEDDTMRLLSYGMILKEYNDQSLQAVSTKKFTMYSLCASIVSKSPSRVKQHYQQLQSDGVPIQELMAIGLIAAAVTAIGKVAV